jgi:hypothetical protein
MNYFQILAIAFGSLLILTRPMFYLFPQRWAHIEMTHIYTEQRPAWVWPVAAFGLALVALTWVQYVRLDVRGSLIVAIVLTLTLIKTSQVLFNYQSFRAWAGRVLTSERRTLNLISVASAALGVALILLGLFVLR